MVGDERTDISIEEFEKGRSQENTKSMVEDIFIQTKGKPISLVQLKERIFGPSSGDLVKEIFASYSFSSAIQPILDEFVAEGKLEKKLVDLKYSKELYYRWTG